MMLRQVWFFFVTQVLAWAVVMLSLAQTDVHPNQVGLSVSYFIVGFGIFYVLKKRFLNAPAGVRVVVLLLTIVSVAAIPMAASSLFR